MILTASNERQLRIIILYIWYSIMKAPIHCLERMDNVPADMTACRLPFLLLYLGGSNRVANADWK